MAVLALWLIALFTRVREGRKMECLASCVEVGSRRKRRQVLEVLCQAPHLLNFGCLLRKSGPCLDRLMKSTRFPCMGDWLEMWAWTAGKAAAVGWERAWSGEYLKMGDK